MIIAGQCKLKCRKNSKKRVMHCYYGDDSLRDYHDSEDDKCPVHLFVSAVLKYSFCNAFRYSLGNSLKSKGSLPTLFYMMILLIVLIVSSTVPYWYLYFDGVLHRAWMGHSSRRKTGRAILYICHKFYNTSC